MSFDEKAIMVAEPLTKRKSIQISFDEILVADFFCCVCVCQTLYGFMPEGSC